jgi:hypothetical protein
MRAQIPKDHTAFPSCAKDFRGESETSLQWLQPLAELAEHSDFLIASTVGSFAFASQEFRMPRLIFMGPKGGGDTIRLGLFATFHGDEPEGAEALVEFFQELERAPGTAKGFHLYAYPVCNPSGLAAGTRDNSAGRDLAAEFWRKSAQPEIYYLEREMGVHAFQGVVSLHTGKSAVRFRAACRSPVLDAAIVQPAIRATRGFVPGVVQESGGSDDFIPSGFLTATDELRPVPFEINLGIPRLLPKPSRVHGTAAALRSLLHSYRELMAHGQNL